LVLAFSLLAASAVSVREDFKIKFRNILYLLPSILLFILIVLYNTGNYESNATLTHIINRGLLLDRLSFFVWCAITLSAIFLLVLLTLKKIKCKHFGFLCTAVISIDLIIFGTLVFRGGYVNTGNLIDYNLIGKLPGKRVIYLDDKVVFGNTSLYYPAWGIFGYSAPFESKNYEALVKNIGFEGIRRPKINSYDAMINLGVSSGLNQLGISAVVEKDGRIVSLPTNSPDLIKSNGLSGTYLLKEEGHVRMLLLADTKTKPDTFIKNYNSWEIHVDGQQVKNPADKNDVFISFNINKGVHSIDLRYVPLTFYYALIVSVLLMVLTICIFVIVFKKFGLKIRETV
jgi:hypothetical protein